MRIHLEFETFFDKIIKLSNDTIFSFTPLGLNFNFEQRYHALQIEFTILGFTWILLLDFRMQEQIDRDIDEALKELEEFNNNFVTPACENCSFFIDSKCANPVSSLLFDDNVNLPPDFYCKYHHWRPEKNVQSIQNQE